LRQTEEAVAFHQIDKALADWFHDARPIVNQRCVKMNEWSAEPEFQIGILGAEDYSRTDDDIPTLIHSRRQSSKATVELRSHGVPNVSWYVLSGVMAVTRLNREPVAGDFLEGRCARLVGKIPPAKHSLPIFDRRVREQRFAQVGDRIAGSQHSQQ
jgi:hypothetical protein